MPQQTINDLLRVLLYSGLSHVLLLMTDFHSQIGLSILIGLLFALLNEIINQLMISNGIGQDNIEKVIELEEILDSKAPNNELSEETIKYLNQINNKK